MDGSKISIVYASMLGQLYTFYFICTFRKRSATERGWLCHDNSDITL